MGKTTSQTIQIKNMCCQRCIEAVDAELKLLNIRVISIKLGEAEFAIRPMVSISVIEQHLQKRGFSIIKTQEEKLVEVVKITLREIVNRLSEQTEKFYLPVYLEQKLKRPYQQLQKTFSKQIGLSVEKYFIRLKVEKVKELIIQNELSFSEISFVTGYKTQQHLASQFKKHTGMSMRRFKLTDKKPRKPIDKI